jgi:hypothetical protein
MAKQKILIRSLPYYKELEKSEAWYNMIPELLQIQQDWIIRNGLIMSLPNNIYPYFVNGVTLWQRGINMAGNNGGYLAAYMFRPIIERIALVWAATNEVGYDIPSIVRTYQSDNRKLRARTTETILEEAQKRDNTINTLYGLLSRYFIHLSYWDSLVLDDKSSQTQTYLKRIEVLPSMLLYDIGNCFQNVISQHLSEKGKSIPEMTGGRNDQYRPLDYIRISQYLFSEKHRKKKGVQLRALFNETDIEGQVGITEIWRGGMEMFRYGDPKKKPEMSSLNEFAILALGKGYKESEVRIHHRKDGSKGEKYEFTWQNPTKSARLLLVLLHGITKVRTYQH